MSERPKIILLVIVTVALLLISVRGCGGYGEVNAATFEHAKALYAVCNRKDTQRLDICATMIDEAAAADEISGKEAGYLREIIDAARNDEWEEAQAMARQLMSDQADL